MKQWQQMVKDGEGPFDSTGDYPCGIAVVGGYLLTEPDKFAIVRLSDLPREATRKEFHVICYNDGIAYVVVGSEEKARVKLLELKREYEARQTLNYGKGGSGPMVYWHIHTVEGELT